MTKRGWLTEGTEDVDLIGVNALFETQDHYIYYYTSVFWTLLYLNRTLMPPIFFAIIVEKWIEFKQRLAIVMGTFAEWQLLFDKRK